jgi:hypothetical protein
MAPQLLVNSDRTIAHVSLSDLCTMSVTGNRPWSDQTFDEHIEQVVGCVRDAGPQDVSRAIMLSGSRSPTAAQRGRFMRALKPVAHLTPRGKAAMLTPSALQRVSFNAIGILFKLFSPSEFRSFMPSQFSAAVAWVGPFADADLRLIVDTLVEMAGIVGLPAQDIVLHRAHGPIDHAANSR